MKQEVLVVSSHMEQLTHQIDSLQLELEERKFDSLKITMTM